MTRLGVCLSIASVLGCEPAREVSAGSEGTELLFLGSASCSSVGPQKMLVILAHPPGVAQQTTVQAATDMFFGAYPSLATFWSEASYGRVSLTGQVVGPYTIAATSCSQFGYTNTSAMAMTAAAADVDLSAFDRIFVVYPVASTTGCNFSGAATLGCEAHGSGDGGTYNASIGWLVENYITSRTHGLQKAAHEGGHNLGLFHGGIVKFGSEALGPVGGSPTYGNEYGDDFTPMGQFYLGHYTGQHKLLMGWIDAGTEAVLDVGGGSATLGPYETTAQVLRVHRQYTNEWLWIEARAAIGYDTMLLPQPNGGALIHWGGSTPTWGMSTLLLDFTPLTISNDDPALLIGQSWTDAYTGTSLAVTSVDGGIRVTASYAPVPCVTSPPVVTLNPSSATVTAGDMAAFSLSVQNRDSVSCPAATFSIASAVPATWSAMVSPASLTLAPLQTQTVTVDVSVPAAARGTFSVDASASRGATTVTASAQVTAAAPCVNAAPTFSISPADQLVDAGDTATYALTLTNNDTGNCLTGTFSLLDTSPAGWFGTLFGRNWGLNPGETRVVTLTEQPPVGTAPDTYGLSVSLTRNDVPANLSVSATCTVACGAGAQCAGGLMCQSGRCTGAGGGAGGGGGGNGGGAAGGTAGGAGGGSAGGSAGGAAGGTAGGSAGGSAGGDAGGSAGGTAGGSAGGDAGGSAGGTAGGSAGGDAGGSAGGSAGGDAGGSAGGDAGGSAGGTAGGSAGGDAGGSAGADPSGVITGSCGCATGSPGGLLLFAGLALRGRRRRGAQPRRGCAPPSSC